MFPFLLLGAAALVLGPILAIIAFARTQGLDELRRSVGALEIEVSDLKRRLRAVVVTDRFEQESERVAPEHRVVRLRVLGERPRRMHDFTAE